MLALLNVQIRCTVSLAVMLLSGGIQEYRMLSLAFLDVFVLGSYANMEVVEIEHMHCLV